jgi:hypothetical protein
VAISGKRRQKTLYLINKALIGLNIILLVSLNGFLLLIYKAL